MLTQDTVARVSRFAVMTCKVESTDISPPTADTGHEVVVPPFILVWWVGFLYIDGAPGDPLPTLLVPAVVTLLWEVVAFLDIVVVVAGVTRAEVASFSRVRGSIGWGGVGGCVHVVGRLAEARFGDWGQRFNKGAWG